MSLIVISGRSGSGKSTALNVLEDMGYYCIDNLPVTLLSPLVDRLSKNYDINKVAVSIDARNIAEDLALFPSVLEGFDSANVASTIIFLDSASPTLVKRFSETRRKHPLSTSERDLREALELESHMLDPISGMAALTIDTTSLTIHELRDEIRTRVAREIHEFALLFQSFAYKRGVPVDADLVFDVRCLPNPHWEPGLRELTGLDEPVQKFLNDQEEFMDMFTDLATFLNRWLPKFEANNRSYLTVAIGCTGGQHRSVFMCRKLYESFESRFSNVQVRHRELNARLKN
ncbi:MAG: RNase adapter RapZ [Pseudomonadales bacterium]|nr:RNase adapter RapZ [Pseudomonadales bacterium]MBO6566018.1 RNase adapter RapZ [Pseudomonadales bacterium]MBO6594225.1 RNase adapter RapZ [Pseudomonadales bacterium]MBO6656312.1 RNase adapter RapZ [Pseudomonadales bacterium]MBO6700724.1 RNase adapter RapZ [Pseudomonadales bacterium]